jgi:hypothetical protein
MKKIIIEPCFNEAQFMEFQIPNICDLLKPDIFVIAEGMFPMGPEFKTTSSDFIQKYTLNGDGKRSFDIRLLQKIVEVNKKKYPDIEFYLVEMKYDPNENTTFSYKKAYNSFKSITQPDPSDLIFTLECDLFFNEQQAEEILILAGKLKPDEAFCSTYQLFFESPYVNWAAFNTDSRRIVYRYGTGKIWGNYDGVPGTPNMFYNNPIYDLKLFHYDWMRAGKYWDARKEQLKRGDIANEYFEKAKSIIKTKMNKIEINKLLQDIWDKRFSTNNLELKDHPTHIHNHPNMVYYYG